MTDPGLNVVALYGAFLSTILALYQIYQNFRKWRRVSVSFEHHTLTLHFDDGSLDDYVIVATVRNISESPVSIEAARFILKYGPGFKESRFIEAELRNGDAACPIPVTGMSSQSFYCYASYWERPFHGKENLPAPHEAKLEFVLRVVGKRERTIEIPGAAPALLSHNVVFHPQNNRRQLRHAEPQAPEYPQT
jgi:hypothetical protein